MRFLNTEFNDFAKHPELDLRPAGLEAKIDALNEWIQPHINDGVYRCGFAQAQDAYEGAFECAPILWPLSFSVWLVAT